MKKNRLLNYLYSQWVLTWTEARVLQGIRKQYLMNRSQSPKPLAKALSLLDLNGERNSTIA